MSSSILFRTSIRSFRSLAPITRPLHPLPLSIPKTFRPIAPIFAQRFYAGSLPQDEVEKRIIEILKGFDKVTDPAKVPIPPNVARCERDGFVGQVLTVDYFVVTFFE